VVLAAQQVVASQQVWLRVRVEVHQAVAQAVVAAVELLQQMQRLLAAMEDHKRKQLAQGVQVVLPVSQVLRVVISRAVAAVAVL
jgi:hypothetical protein